MYSETIVVGAGTKYPLNGLLTLPGDLSKPVPAVVMVHGSGASNMDEKVMKLTPFKDLAEGLARHGIASLRYDKRSFAHGLKMIRNRSLTVKEETIEDAILAVKMLREDPQAAQAGRARQVAHEPDRPAGARILPQEIPGALRDERRGGEEKEVRGEPDALLLQGDGSKNCGRLSFGKS